MYASDRNSSNVKLHLGAESARASRDEERRVFRDALLSCNIFHRITLYDVSTSSDTRFEFRLAQVLINQKINT